MKDKSAGKPRGLFKRIVSYGFLIVIIGVPVAHFLWGIWAAHRLNTVLATLHAQGEPIHFAELKLDSVPDAENASLDYLAAGDLIDTTTPAWKQYDISTRDNFRLPLPDSERVTVHAIVQENTAALSRVTAARGKSVGGWNDYTPDVLTPYHLNSVRTVANLLRFAAENAHLQGDDQNALQWVQDELHEADAAEHRPLIVGHLVAIGCNALTCSTISELAPDLHIGSKHLTRQDIVNLLHQLQDESALNEGGKLAWRSERIAAINTMREMTDGKLSSPVFANPGGPTSPTVARIQGYLIKPMALNDASMYANYLQDEMIAQAAANWPTARGEYPTEMMKIVEAQPKLHLFLAILAPSLEKAVRIDFGAKSERRMATVALAARLYAADHNDQLPPSLANLVPAYLPAIPDDAMTGTPLKYKSDPPRIYGLGDDGVDYGGQPQDPDSHDKARRHHGDLVVYLQTQPRKQPAKP